MKLRRGYITKIVLLAGIAHILSGCQGNSDKIVNQNNQQTGKTVTVSVASPVDNAVFTQDALMTFKGSAVLGSNTQIEPENLIWTSDRDGVIGVGNSFKRSGLSPGEHTVTFSATASSGEKGSASFRLTNQPKTGEMIVRIESPAGRSIMPYDLVELKGKAFLPDGTPVTNPLAFEWRSSLETDPDPVLGNSSKIAPGGLIPGLHTITLNVSAMDGNGNTITGNASIDLFVEYFNSGVTLDITEPVNGFRNTQGQDLICNSSASVVGGGMPQEYIWTSSIDGVIGSSVTCIVPYLSLGTHRITVTATTADGKKAASSILVEVQQ